MKNKMQNQKNKSLQGSASSSGVSAKGEKNTARRSGGNHSHAGGVNQRAGGAHSGAGGENLTAGGAHRSIGGSPNGTGGNNPRSGGSFYPENEKNKRAAGSLILLALAVSSKDYIPHSDADFDEWQKNYVRHLSSPWPPAEFGAPAPAPTGTGPSPSLLYVYLGIPEERYTTLTDMKKQWDKDYARGGKESDRRSSEAKAKQKTRKDYVRMLRSLSKQYILYNDKTSDEIKRALKLTVPDTEPSPVHGSHLGTLAPDVFLKNMGGGKIDVRFKKPSDQNRGSVPKGFEAELRYVIGTTLPPDPEDIVGKNIIISSKARFQFDGGMTNLGKTLRSYARWRHKTDSQKNSPWMSVMEITIA